MKKRVSDLITIDDLQSWTPDTPVIILAPTASGKSHLIKNTLYELSCETQRQILMLIDRLITVNQFRAELERADEDNGTNKADTIHVDTYQLIQYNELHGREYDFDLSKFSFVVADEFHYFIADADFNKATDVAFEKIMSMTDKIKIFMSATGEDVASYIKDYPNRTWKDPLVYKLDIPPQTIGHLNYYYDNAVLDVIAEKILSGKDKGIFFIQSAKRAYEFFRKYKEHALFNCSEYNTAYAEHVDRDAIKKMLVEEKFEKQLLITTTALSTGVNLIDRDIKHIILDVPDVGELIQCLGRKRQIDGMDIPEVYIKAFDNKSLNGRKSKLAKALEMADYFRETNTSELLKKYPRQVDYNGIIYDKPIPGETDVCTKRINELRYLKKRLDIKEIDQMIETGKYGYCQYVAKRLCKYNEVEDRYDYTVIRGDGTLPDYLESHVGVEMLQVRDRKKLIETMNVRSDGKLKKSRDVLNAALKEDNLPYIITEYSTSRIINGIKKNYKAVWTIERRDWSVQM